MFLLLLSSCFKIPHPSKQHFGGEDACFTSDENSAVGVADGVGGWVTISGSNSSKYSNDLMEFSKHYSYLSSPLEILERAYEHIDLTIPGSTTATIAKLNHNNLSFINLGDSGCGVFRNFLHIFQTQSTTHGFNFPYQLGYGSQTVPSNGTLENITVENNDILVCASDGLWDNVFIHKIENILQDTYTLYEDDQNKFVTEAAESLARQAFENGSNTDYESPFYLEAKKIDSRMPKGGKLDDITVVVSLINQDHDL